VCTESSELPRWNLIPADLLYIHYMVWLPLARYAAVFDGAAKASFLYYLCASCELMLMSFGTLGTLGVFVGF
jgi:hypothetical protein